MLKEEEHVICPLIWYSIKAQYIKAAELYSSSNPTNSTGNNNNVPKGWQ